MTLVISMKMNDNYVMGISDEQVTYAGPMSYRTADVSQKLHDVDNNHFIGSSGSVGFSNDVINRTLEEVKNDMDTKTIAELVQKNVRDIKNELRQSIIGDDYCIDIKDARKENSGIHIKILEEIEKRVYNLDNDLGSTFVISGIDDTSQIFITPYRGKPIFERQYALIGSGYDRSQIIVEDYISKLKPEDRHKINPGEGCKIMMNATRSAWKNEGVGGRTQVTWVDENKKINHLSSDKSNILQNVLYCESVGLFNTDYTNGIFKDIIEQGATKIDMMNGIRKKISKKDLADVFFVKGLHS